MQFFLLTILKLKTMYSILIKEFDSPDCLPILVSTNTHLYFDYLLSGYQEITKGTKKFCLEVISDMLTAYAD